MAEAMRDRTTEEPVPMETHRAALLEKEQACEAALRAQQEAHAAALLEKEAAYGAALDKMRLDFAVDSALAAAGARNKRAVKALLDLEALAFGANGGVEALETQLDALRESDGYLFAAKDPGPAKETTPGGPVPAALVGVTPLEGSGLPGGKGPGEMSYEELCGYFAGV